MLRVHKVQDSELEDVQGGFTPLAVQVAHSHHRFIYKDPSKEVEKCVKPLISEMENHRSGI